MNQRRRRGFFSRKTLLILFCGFGALVFLALAALLVENWRGQRAWERHRQELQAKGEQFDWRAFVPSTVPDESNMAAADLFVWSLDYGVGPAGRPRTRRPADPSDPLRSLSPSRGQGRLKKAPGFGDVQKNTVTDLERWREFYLDNSDYALDAASGSAATDVLKALSNRDAALAELREAAARPHSRFPVRYEDNFSALIPHVAVLRGVVGLLHLRCVAHLEKGQTTEAFEDLKLSLRVADAIRDEPLLISHLVRIAQLQQIEQSVKEGLDRHRWSGEQLQFIQNWFAQVNLLGECKHSLRAERAFALEAFNHLRLLESADPSVASLRRWLPPGWVAQNKLSYTRVLQDFAVGAIDEKSQRVSPQLLEGLDTTVMKMGKNPYTVLARLLLPALSKTALKSSRAQTYANFTELACALERHRLAHGSYPEKLEAIVPQFIAAIPRETVEDEPLRYEREAPDRFSLDSNGWSVARVEAAGDIQSRREDAGPWQWQSSSR